MTSLFERHCHDTAARLVADGRVVPGASFTVVRGPGYGDMQWQVNYGDQAFANCGMHTQEIAQRYADGFQRALDDLLLDRVLASVPTPSALVAN